MMLKKLNYFFVRLRRQGEIVHFSVFESLFFFPDDSLLCICILSLQLVIFGVVWLR